MAGRYDVRRLGELVEAAIDETSDDRFLLKVLEDYGWDPNQGGGWPSYGPGRPTPTRLFGRGRETTAHPSALDIGGAWAAFNDGVCAMQTLMPIKTRATSI